MQPTKLLNNTGRKERLWTEKGQGEKIFVYKVSDERQRLIYVSIFTSILCDNKDPGDFAILYRTNTNPEQLKMPMRYGILIVCMICKIL